MRLTWPLTGRAEEMRLISAAISNEDAAGVVLWGAAGVGKSRIAREALAAAASRGAEIRWAVATTSARTLPLAAFAAFASSGSADTLQLVRSVIEALTAAPQAPRWSSLSMMSICSMTSRRSCSNRSLRDDPPRSCSPSELRSRFPPGVQEMWKHGQFDRIDLQPISRDETATLLAAVLGGPVDADATRRLWNLTRGNVLYLRNIVEQEAGDGRLIKQHGYWAWTGKPFVPTSLAEVIEARIGALPAEVGEVVDTLAVGEPIELPSLCRITGAAAVEEAEIRGLIRLEHIDDRIEVRVAHPLYGEVRRARAPSTRLRRLRGRVATELAYGDDCDDMRTVVRRAALSLDSDLEPDTDLLVRAAHGAVWLGELPLADRLAEAAMRAGGGAEAYIIRGCNLSGLSRGKDADAVLAAVPTTGFTAADHARLTFIRVMNTLFTLADPAGAKGLIDDASLSTTPEGRGCIDAASVVYWAMMGNPESACKASQGLCLDELPAVVGAQTAALLAVAAGDAGRTTDAVAAAGTGYTIVDGSFDAENVRFVVADGHIGALLNSGAIAEALLAADRLRRQWADLPGAHSIARSCRSGSSGPWRRSPRPRVLAAGADRNDGRRGQRLGLPILLASRHGAGHARLGRHGGRCAGDDRAA
jgi:hypothetical protein